MLRHQTCDHNNRFGVAVDETRCWWRRRFLEIASLSAVNYRFCDERCGRPTGGQGFGHVCGARLGMEPLEIGLSRPTGIGCSGDEAGTGLKRRGSCNLGREAKTKEDHPYTQPAVNGTPDLSLRALSLEKAYRVNLRRSTGKFVADNRGAGCLMTLESVQPMQKRMG